MSNPFMPPSADIGKDERKRPLGQRILYAAVSVISNSAVSLLIIFLLFIPIELAFDLTIGYGPASYGQHALILLELIPLAPIVGIMSALLWVNSSFGRMMFIAAVVVSVALNQTVSVAALSMASFVSLTIVTGLSIGAAILIVSRLNKPTA